MYDLFHCLLCPSRNIRTVYKPNECTYISIHTRCMNVRAYVCGTDDCLSILYTSIIFQYVWTRTILPLNGEVRRSSALLCAAFSGAQTYYYYYYCSSKIVWLVTERLQHTPVGHESVNGPFDCKAFIWTIIIRKCQMFSWVWDYQKNSFQWFMFPSWFRRLLRTHLRDKIVVGRW